MDMEEKQVKEKILLVDDESSVRDALREILTQEGYQVVVATNGREGLRMVDRESPDLVLLDVTMPVMDGFQALQRLKEDSYTASVPVVMLSNFPMVEGEATGLGLGAQYYIPKPWEPENVKLIVKVALQESRQVKEAAGEAEPEPGPDLKRFVQMGDLLKPLEKIMDGGLLRGSITLLEGGPASGKSILCQHILHSVLDSGDGVAYFTSQLADGQALASQMRSIGMRVDEHLSSTRLFVYAMQEFGPGEDPGPMLTSLAVDIELMPLKDHLLVIDAITTLVVHTRDLSIFFSFFASCKQVGAKGCTIILVMDSYAFDEAVLVRLRAICDNHIALRTEKLRAKDA